MIRVITFATEEYTTSAAMLKESALRNGADDVVTYSQKDLDPFFWKIQAKILDDKSHHRWAWYAWKPYVVLKAILDMQINDTLAYIDAGKQVIAPLRNIIGVMEDDVFLFCNCFKHVEWCKMDVLFAINKASFTEVKTMSETYYSISDNLAEAHQAQASSIFLRVTERSINFCKEWYAWSLIDGMINNAPSKLPNYPTFQEHRFDQSLLTSVAIKWGVKTHWFPSHTGFHIKQNHPEDTYPAMFFHHRKTNDQW